MAVVLSAVVGVLILWRLFRPFFGDAEGFRKCVEFAFTPDIISLVRREYIEDWAAEVKLLIWFLLGLSGAIGSFVLLSTLFK